MAVHGSDLDYRRLGRFLRALRERRGWSLEHASQKLGIAKATLGRLETEGAPPKLRVLQEAAVVYEVTVSELWAQMLDGSVSTLEEEMAKELKVVRRDLVDTKAMLARAQQVLRDGLLALEADLDAATRDDHVLSMPRAPGGEEALREVDAVLGVQKEDAANPLED